MPNSTYKQMTACIPYGSDEFGRLESVLLHTPGEELGLINDSNCQYWLFDDVPNVQKFIEEHKRYRELLIAHGVKVYELSDYVEATRELINRMPNLTYLHDIAVVSQKGAILSRMAWAGRREEQAVVKEALNNLGIPILIEFEETEDAFEGCLLLSRDTIFVANTERHKRSTIRKFISAALDSFEEVIYVNVPKRRRFMHPDTIFNRITHDLALAYLPAFEDTYLFCNGSARKIDFAEYMKQRGIEIVNVSDSEQRRLACSFVPLESGVIIHYDTALDKETQKLLAKKGVELILFHPEALLAGGGSLRCLTLRLHRENNASQF